jgi:hypothetical protein
MANQNRRTNMRFRMSSAGQSRKGRSTYISLSQVEDVSDRAFLINIARDAARNAINENRAMNIPVTVIENGWVVKKTSAGTTERIAEVTSNNTSKRKKVLTKGAVLHVKTRQ